MKSEHTTVLLAWTLIAMSVLEASTTCVDAPQCQNWAENHECELYSVDMLTTCPKACHNPCLCDVSAVSNDTACDCLVKAKSGYCTTATALMDCETTCGLMQSVLCPVLGQPADPHAYLSTTSRKYLTIVTEVCLPGYNVNTFLNKGRKVCISTGQWYSDSSFGGSALCNPVDCKSPPPSEHTEVQANGTTFRYEARYSCEPGYLPLSGQETLICASTGRWLGELLVCVALDCGAPPSITYTLLEVDNTTLGNTANYTCVEGYTSSPLEASLTCNTTGDWSGPRLDCALIECGPPPEPAHTQLQATGTSYGHNTSYTCVTGYEKGQGYNVLTCEAAGLWEGELLECQIKDCGKPEVNSMTEVIFSATTYMSVADYSCELGHRIIDGDIQRTCQDNKTWSGDALSCLPLDCGAPPSLLHTILQVDATSLGNTASYTCEKGYKSFPTETLLTCDTSGTWAGSRPECDLIECGPPPHLAHAELQATGTSYGHSTSYTCVTGYEMSEGHNILTCKADGLWEGDFLLCYIKDCGAPEVRSKTTAIFSATTYMSVAEYSCELGYQVIDGDIQRSCQDNKTWSGDALTCLPVDCGAPPSLPHTLVQVDATSLGNTARYTCEEGYTSSPFESTLTCGTSGEWTGNRPDCALIECGPPPQPVHTELQATGTSYGHSTSYTCATGYEEGEGHSALTCRATGLWEGQPLQCQIKDCGAPEVRSKTTAIFSATTYMSVAEYSCDLGYQVIDGDIQRTCQDNKTWSGNALVCLPVICDSAPIFAGAHQWSMDFEGHYQYQDKVYYGCYYENEGQEGKQWVLHCGPTTEWEGEEPKCGAASPFKKKIYQPEPVEAPGSWAVGMVIFGVICSIFVLFVIMDVNMLRSHSKYLKENLACFRKTMQKKWQRFRGRFTRKEDTSSPVTEVDDFGAEPCTPCSVSDVPMLEQLTSPPLTTSYPKPDVELP